MIAKAMEGEPVDIPSYVLAFQIAERLRTTPMDIAPTLDPLADERAPVYWVQAAINMIEAEQMVRKSQANDEMSDASKKRAKGRGRGALGRGG